MLKKMIRVSFISLGCAKNRVDSEVIIGSFLQEGFQLVSSVKDSHVAVINTCAFIKSARHEAFQTIKEVIGLKKRENCKLKIVVVGCLVEYIKKFKYSIFPQVDLLVPIEKYPQLPVLIKKMVFPEAYPKKNIPAGYSRFLSSSPYSVYIKIADGCDNRCSYCLIPSLRGKMRSKALDEIISEIKAVERLGAREIVLVAQDTAAYGKDIYGKFMLDYLLRKIISKAKGIHWIRVLYSHPVHITSELIEVIAGEEKICKYIDMPLQHVNDKILELMGRKIKKAEIISLYEKIREQIPGVTLRTTVMTGYPGEGEEEFEELLDFLRNYPFERLGAFSYSDEKGTVSYFHKPKVEKATREKRLEKIMEQQKMISKKGNKRLLGEKREVIIDIYDSKKRKAYGRLSSQAPEVDGKVFVSRTGEVRPGDFIKVKITGIGCYDLMGERIQ